MVALIAFFVALYGGVYSTTCKVNSDYLSSDSTSKVDFHLSCEDRFCNCETPFHQQHQSTAIQVTIPERQRVMLFPWEEESEDPLSGMRMISMADRAPSFVPPTLSPVSTTLLRTSLEAVARDGNSQTLTDDGECDQFQLEPVSKRKKTIRRREDSDVKKNRLISAWMRVVLLDPECSQVGMQLKDKSEDEQRFILQLVLQEKAANTLSTRLSPISALLMWLKQSIFRWPPDEETCYLFLLTHTSMGSAKSRADSFMKSITFFAFTFESKALKLVSISKRLLGWAAKGLAQLGLRKQSMLLLTSEVVYLEFLMDQGAINQLTRMVVGTYLILLYLRARYSDVISIINVSLESTLLVIQVRGTKTSRLYTDRLPVHLVAPRNTLSGSDWIKTFLDWRRDIGVELGQFPLMPSYSNDQWEKHLAELADFNMQLKNSLAICQVTNPFCRTSHSAKGFMLNLASKAGLPKPTRQALGYHKQASDRSVNAYSRDALAEPIEKLSEVINLVLTNKFMPDEIPGSRWPKQIADSVDMEGSSSSTSQDSESSGPSLMADNEASILAVVEAASTATDELTTDDRLFMNHSNSKLHRGKPGFLMKTACGNEVTTSYVQFPALEVGVTDMRNTCDTCFKSKVGRVLKARLSDQSLSNQAA